MASLPVRTMTAADEDAAVNTIVLAFAADPVARWTWPNAPQFLAAMPKLVRAFGGNAFAQGSAYGTAGQEGAALWLPPGVQPDEEAMGAVMASTVPPAELDAVMSTFEQMATYHPHEPHWYLPLIGVDPAHQGRGHGDALMRHALARCDRDRLPAYLESTNARNIPFYKRHDFAPLGEIRVGTGAVLTPMLRKAR